MWRMKEKEPEKAAKPLDRGAYLTPVKESVRKETDTLSGKSLRWQFGPTEGPVRPTRGPGANIT